MSVRFRLFEVKYTCDACGIEATTTQECENGDTPGHRSLPAQWRTSYGYHFCADCGYLDSVSANANSRINRVLRALSAEPEEHREFWREFHAKYRELYGNRKSQVERLREARQPKSSDARAEA